MMTQIVDIEARETGPLWARDRLEDVGVGPSFNVERTMMFVGCSHEVGHPVAVTPAYLVNRGTDEPAFQHGCCGCCQDPGGRED